MFVTRAHEAQDVWPHDPPHKAFVFSSRPIWILVPLWGLIMALAVVSTPRPAHAQEAEVLSRHVTHENCAQTKSDSKIFNKAADDPRAIEERKKCFSSHFKSDAKPERKAVKGERVMQPEYGADASSHEAAHTVQQKNPKPERASGYLKIGDIKGESKD